MDALPWSSFIRLVSIQNIKSCGTKIEKRIISANGWEKIKGQKNHGDAKTAAGQIVEIKSSIVSPLLTSGVTFRGIRLWSAMDFYCFVLTNFQTPNWEPVSTVFKLTSEDLKTESAFGILKPYNMKKNDRARMTKLNWVLVFQFLIEIRPISAGWRDIRPQKSGLIIWNLKLKRSKHHKVLLPLSPWDQDRAPFS
ncbi:MAG: hypothetical protein IPK04_15860 [Bdellovibrionales bacterium]|nr:hypothetical protein [Bdellovibrionales bacterium]